MKREGRDKRKYIRLGTVFPVDFQLVDRDKRATSDVLKGFTRDVSRGGMCVESRLRKGQKALNFALGKSRLKLIINIPAGLIVTNSFATVRWSEKVTEDALDTYRFGVEYDEIDSDNQDMIYRHVLWLYKKPRVVTLFLVILVAMITLLMYLGIRPS
ncbi:MAG: PilZ domain-containing protein [Candidatus Omnitrophica bacterium]|nr:PilZ domain-containing protein [Candidatus Omnitrophota bacterium]